MPRDDLAERCGRKKLKRFSAGLLGILQNALIEGAAAREELLPLF